VTKSAAFTLADNWHGGFYELSLELGATSDARLERALTRLGEVVAVPSWYGSRDREPYEQMAVSCTFESLRRYQHLRVVELPDGTPVVCGVVAVREVCGSDWLDFYNICRWVRWGVLIHGWTLSRIRSTARVGGLTSTGGGRSMSGWRISRGRYMPVSTTRLA
jgi:hypothetical protein